MEQKMVRVKSVQVVEQWTVQLEFTDGTRKILDLQPFLHGPIFEPLRSDPEQFRTVHVDQQLGTIVWNNGADIDPDVLYGSLTPAWMAEELTRSS